MAWRFLVALVALLFWILGDIFEALAAGCYWVEEKLLP